jgi:hypothetical protein
LDAKAGHTFTNKKLTYTDLAMKIINRIVSLLADRKRKPVYGIGIFQHQSWLDKQVQEAQWKRRFLVD